MSARLDAPTTESRITSVTHPARRNGAGFAAATASFVAVFAAGAVPIPLYDRYRAQNAITTTGLSRAAVAYFVLAVGALLVLGRLSDHLGRRPVALAALAVAALGSLTFLTLHSEAQLVTGRALQGLAAGLASSTMAAWAVDAAPPRPRWLVATVTSAATTIGLSLGAFGAGLLADLAPWPRQLPYLLIIAVLLACAVGVLRAPEPLARVGGALASLRPRLVLPPAVRPYAPAATAVFVATWAFGGYFQSFGSAVAADDLHSRSAVLAAAVFASYMAPSVLGGPLSTPIRPQLAQRIGMALVVIAGAGLVLSTAAGSAPVFLAAGVTGGLGMGLAMSGGMRTLLPAAAPTQRAGLLALVYATSYLGAALPSLVAGQLARAVPLVPITAGYTALAVAALVVTLVPIRTRITPSPPPK